MGWSDEVRTNFWFYIAIGALVIILGMTMQDLWGVF